MKKSTFPIELFKASDNSIIIHGKELSCEWLDSYIIIWSKKDHKYKNVKPERSKHK